MKILAVVKTRRTTASPKRWRWDCWWWWVVSLLGISVPQQPQPPRPTLVVCRHRTVTLSYLHTNSFARILFNSLPAISRSLNSCIFFFTKHNLTLTRSGKVNGMVSNLQHYPYVHITNNTPYATRYPYGVNVVYVGCSSDYVYEAIAPGGSWTASSRGLCLVHFVSAILALPGYGGGKDCGQYKSSGTSYSQYSIIMDGEDACSVVRIWTGKPSLYLGYYCRKKKSYHKDRVPYTFFRSYRP